MTAKNQNEEPMESTDCLVLEIYSDDYNKMFILYDYYEKSYLIKGLNNLSNDFSFRCNHVDDIYNFIEFMFHSQNQLSILLHNYKEIPYETKNIYFEFLNDVFDNNPYDCNILVSKTIDLKQFSSMELIKEQLRVCKNFYNKY